VVAVGFVVVLTGCGARANAPLPASEPALGAARRATSASPIKHIVIIVQENRTPDYLFQGIPHADIATTALDSEGKIVALHQVSLAAGYDLSHRNAAFITDYDGGKMDGFDRNLPPSDDMRPYGYAPRKEVSPYHQMARQYVLADRMFQTNQSGSFPSHQYLVSGASSAEPVSSDDVDSNGLNKKNLKQNAPVGCDAPARSIVDTIDPATGYPGPTPFPCFDRPALSDVLDAAGVTWRYYQHDLGPGLWHAYDAIQHVRYGPDYANVVSPSQTILSDVATGNLAGVSWVMPPSNAYSDHSGDASAKGPSWVAAVVNAIGTSRYWNSTAILIVWDDWGGWYDHVVPPQFNAYELGFRVPLLVVSPYAKKAHVSHVQYEFGSLLKFAETTFGLSSLGATDVRANDLTDAFNFGHPARAFTPIKAPPFNPGPDTRDGAPNPEDP
ncbi:MAG TPA: alkaline phosphatase family protein, partial [Candidatus Tumulicola sp.]